MSFTILKQRKLFVIFLDSSFLLLSARGTTNVDVVDVQNVDEICAKMAKPTKTQNLLITTNWAIIRSFLHYGLSTTNKNN